jgi:hypothetical protein
LPYRVFEFQVSERREELLGQIASDVRAQHLRIYDKEETLLKSILHHFDVNYARRMKAAGTTVSAYLLQPDTLVKSLFGFTDELLFIVSDYDKIQSRTMQAVEQIYSEQPFKARANPLTYIIVFQGFGCPVVCT